MSKDPFGFAGEVYIWVIGLASAGGLVAALKRDNQVVRKTIADLLASALSGPLTFWLCQALDVNPLIAAVAIAINGYLGSRALDKMAVLSDKYLGLTTPPTQQPPTSTDDKPKD